ncbi:proteasome assembly chaperone 4-like [Thrips palmi]|uniref:Proteasome assembly chaperone 4-like n=1 Tax=Thrips palmi TaxID=161013 RepID=A0A6P9A9G3_THRPL|nr:proteasome assembly chaperone 4-like [Thrips palmi]XP_034253945.1 proteasome assembly chaperone 4-like [Thrips palmi]
MEVASIEYCEPKLVSHGFHFKACEQGVVVKALKLEKGLFIWVGALSQPVLEDLALSMSTPYEHDPIQTKLMGDVLNMTSMNLGSRLSKKLGKPVYLSFNLECDKMSLPAIEAGIVEEIKKHPHLF